MNDLTPKEMREHLEAISKTGKQKLCLCPNGRLDAEFWYLVLRDLEDPDNGMIDHFTSFYPKTIKSAIRMFNLY